MKIINIHLPNPPGTRDCNNCDDWGDDLTIGKHLKKRSTNFYQFQDSDFAIYLGSNMVGVKDENRTTIQYPSEEEMKKVWILD